jgi:hypothetical protein
VAKFDEFKHLTCVHSNCTDQYLLASASPLAGAVVAGDVC